MKKILALLFVGLFSVSAFAAKDDECKNKKTGEDENCPAGFILAASKHASGSTIATATTVVVGTLVIGTIASGLDNTGTTGTVN
jgi:hypothetical protein